MVIGKDINDIPRVWGENQTQAFLAAQEYLRKRPDTGPLSGWIFEQGEVFNYPEPPFKV